MKMKILKAFLRICKNLSAASLITRIKNSTINLNVSYNKFF